MYFNINIQLIKRNLFGLGKKKTIFYIFFKRKIITAALIKKKYTFRKCKKVFLCKTVRI